ncbi:MAG: hypothetical protein J6P14_00825 [Ruminococcus sp.]|nr:hypothetical protein [Ruminococcus sp.]
MELILVLIVVIVLCKILGVSNEMIIAGGLVLIELTIIAMLLLFAYFIVRLLFTKRKKARFSRIDKAENGKYKVAFYIVDGEEYPCIFPSEVILNDKMYRTDKEYHVMFSKSMKKVYDIYTIITCVVGFFASASAVFMTMQIVSMMELF